jgi:DNA ligase-1
MLLSELTSTSEQIGATRARSTKVRLLAELLRRHPPEESALGVSYLSGTLRQGKIGIGYAGVRKASEVAPASSASLALADVDTALDRYAQLNGKGSQAARAQLLGELMARATGPEQLFLQKLLVGELRQGALEGLMSDAIAEAAAVPSASVRRAVMFTGDLGEVAKVALIEREAGLARFRLQLMQPLKPMLAQPAADLAEALGELGEAALEYKLDGARVQVHRDGDAVRVFSREGNDVTAAAPELVRAALALPARSLVLDGEAIALRPDGSPLPFQQTMRRFGRKLNVEELKDSLPLSCVFFDLLHLDGGDLVDQPLSERARTLEGLLPRELRVERLVTADVEAADAFYDQALQRGHEGLLAKSLIAPYEAGRRGSGWRKLKPAHTFDLVVLAAEWGSGRRQGWLSNLHLGARDPKTGGFVMLGKTFKGMTDAMLQWQTEWLLAHELSRDAFTVHVKPELVVEIAFDGVQVSPHYPGGVALRFARVKRYREDKSAAEADLIDAVLKLLPQQS